jgi:hypothetical protein
MRINTFVHHLPRLILVAFIVLAFCAAPVFAQVAPTNPILKAESDYRYQFDLYRTAYQLYQVNKSEYLKAKTLKSEQEALQAAIGAALNRNDVQSAYGQWLRLQLLQYKDIYPLSGVLSDRLAKQNEWYLTNKALISSSGNKQVFESNMTDYETTLIDRDRLFGQSQVELKLAHLYRIRKDIEAKLSSIRPVLEAKKDIPEVEQGLTRVDEHFSDIDRNISLLSDEVKLLEIGGVKNEKNDPKRVLPRSTTKLETINKLELEVVNILIELDTNYARN